MSEIKTLVKALEESKKRDHGIIFIYSDKKEEMITYKELYQSALVVLNNLNNKGLKKGDELVFQMTDNKGFLMIFWACICGGIIPVPITFGYGKENGVKVEKIWTKLKKPYLVYSNNYYERFMALLDDVISDKSIIDSINASSFSVEEIIMGKKAAVAEEINEDDTAYIQFSSGSTGTPKGVVLTHKNLMTNIYAIIDGCNAAASDGVISWMPLTHDMGLIGLHLTPLVAGCMQYNMMPALFIKKPDLLFDKVTNYKLTITAFPNFGYAHIINAIDKKPGFNWDLSSIRVIFNGAEMISYDLCLKFLDYMEKYKLNRLAMFPVYGMAEASLAVTFPKLNTGLNAAAIDRASVSIGSRAIDVNVDDNRKAMYVELGYPVNDCEVLIVDDQMDVLEEKYVGNIYISGNNVTSGYYGEETTKALINNEYWLETGDVGFINEHGLVVLGRTKELIIINGQNYYCSDLERVLETIINCRSGKVVIVSQFDGEKEVLIAFIVSLADLNKFTEDLDKIRYEFYRQAGLGIDMIIPIKHIPKTTSGKIQRYKLLDEYVRGDFDTQLEEINNIRKERFKNRNVEPPTTDIEKDITSIIENVLKIGKISMTDNLFSFSIQSIQVVRIFDEISRRYPGKIMIADLYKYHSIKELAGAIVSGKNLKVIKSEWPQGYLAEGSNNLNSPSAQVLIDLEDAAYNKIIRIIEYIGSDPVDIIFSMIAYLNWDEMQKQEFIGYKTSGPDGLVSEIFIKFDQISDIFELIAQVPNSIQRQIDGAELMKCVKDSLEESFLSTFVCSAELINVDLKSLPFDLIVCVAEKRNKNQISIRAAYDQKYINSSRVKQLLASIKALIESIELAERS